MVEFHVLRCADCQTFQVLQVTKTSKWKCKLCGQKQSVIKVYGRGTGADCRKHVQKLNTLRGQLDHLAEEQNLSSASSLAIRPSSCFSSPEENETFINKHGMAEPPKPSRWSSFVEEPQCKNELFEEDDERSKVDTQVTTDWRDYRTSKRSLKRKRGEDGNFPVSARPKTWRQQTSQAGVESENFTKHQAENLGLGQDSWNCASENFSYCRNSTSYNGHDTTTCGNNDTNFFSKVDPVAKESRVTFTTTLPPRSQQENREHSLIQFNHSLNSSDSQSSSHIMQEHQDEFGYDKQQYLPTAQATKFGKTKLKQTSSCKTQAQKSPLSSKWGKFLEEDVDDESSEDDDSNDNNDFHGYMVDKLHTSNTSCLKTTSSPLGNHSQDTNKCTGLTSAQAGCKPSTAVPYAAGTGRRESVSVLEQNNIDQNKDAPRRNSLADTKVFSSQWDKFRFNSAKSYKDSQTCVKSSLQPIQTQHENNSHIFQGVFDLGFDISADDLDF